MISVDFLNPIYFKKQMLDKNGCPLCLHDTDLDAERKMNDEHVVSKWILKNLTGFDAKQGNRFTGTKIDLSKFKIRICEDCNTFMKKQLEDKVDSIFKEESETGKPSPHADKDLIAAWAIWVFLKYRVHQFRRPRFQDRHHRHHKTPRILIRDVTRFHYLFLLLHRFLQEGTMPEVYVPTNYAYSIEKNAFGFRKFGLTVSSDDPCVQIRFGSVGRIFALDDGGLVGRMGVLPIKKTDGIIISHAQFIELFVEIQCARRRIASLPRMGLGATLPEGKISFLDVSRLRSDLLEYHHDERAFFLINALSEIEFSFFDFDRTPLREIDFRFASFFPERVGFKCCYMADVLLTPTDSEIEDLRAKMKDHVNAIPMAVQLETEIVPFVR